MVDPTSEYWTVKHHEPGNYSATNAFMGIAELAYPLDTDDLNPAHIDSVLTYLEAVARRHPETGVQAEFLYKALSTAHALGRTSDARKYYERLTSEHNRSEYAREAEEYAPDRLVQIGKQIPSFKFPTLEDTSQTHAPEEFKGQVFLLDFWGTWCGPCIGKMPQLHKAYRKFQDNGFEILSVAMHDERKDVETFRSEKWEMPWKHAFIPESSAKEEEVVSRFGARSFPNPILINEDGTIIATKQELARKNLSDMLTNIFENASEK